MNTFDRTVINKNISTAIEELDCALRSIIYAKDEIENKFSGESFDTYLELLDGLYDNILKAKKQLEWLYT